MQTEWNGNEGDITSSYLLLCLFGTTLEASISQLYMQIPMMKLQNEGFCESITGLYLHTLWTANAVFSKVGSTVRKSGQALGIATSWANSWIELVVIVVRKECC